MRSAGETSLFEIAGKLCTVVHALHPSNILKTREDSAEDGSSERRRRMHRAALLDFAFLRAVNAAQDTIVVGNGGDKLRKMALGNVSLL